MALLYSATLEAGDSSDEIDVVANKVLGIVVDTQVQILIENAESGIFQPFGIVTGPDVLIPPAAKIKVVAISADAQITLHGDEP